MLETILSDRSIQDAIQHIRKKKGAPGIDGMTADELPAYWDRYGNRIKECIYHGTYRPRPVLACYIPKPGKKEKRKLEIPCTLDRMILYSMQMVMTPLYEPFFSKSSFGFRNGLGCLDAISACLSHINEGTNYTVDLDIKKFFDNVDHHLLLQFLEKDISDRRLLELIKRYIKPFVADKGGCYQKAVGLPQGSAISPLLANVFLDKFDHYMDQLHIRFIRYADDIVIFCKTRQEAEVNLIKARDYLYRILKLKLNKEKTKIVRPWNLHFLGYGVAMKTKNNYVLTIDSETKIKMLSRMKAIMDKTYSSPKEWWEKLGGFNRGWINYYKDADPSAMLAFLYMAEQYQSMFFINKIHSIDSTAEQQYMRALHLCTSYSSLMGWYQKQNKSIAERIDKMANKYTFWRSSLFYNHKKHFRKLYCSLTDKPFYYQLENCTIEMSTFCNNTKQVTTLDNTQFLIIGILAAGKFMTLFQLMSYLALKGVAIQSQSLISLLNQLTQDGILKRHTLYQKNTAHDTDNTLMDYYFHCYSIGYNGKKFVREICAPSDYAIKPRDPANIAEILSLSTSAVLWNQIILNYIAYEPAFRFFQMQITKSLTQHSKLSIPLRIQTYRIDFIFEYIHEASQPRIHNIIQKWNLYQKLHARNTRFVLISDHYDQLLECKKYMLKEFFSKQTINELNILFSVVHSWFANKHGMFIPYHMIMEPR